MRALCIALVASCASSRTAPPSLVDNTRSPAAPVEPALDYRRPVQVPAESRAARTAPHESECRRGDPDACLRASMRLGNNYDLYSEMEANCKAGHELSCRAILTSEGKGVDYPLKLPPAELRRGCAAGLWAECDVLLLSNVWDDFLFGAEIQCLQARRVCYIASRLYRTARSPNYERARYLLELGCQAEDSGSCSDLATEYLKGTFVEPVPGRGMQIARFVCTRLQHMPCPLNPFASW